MADKFILSIDLGTSGPKVALFSTQGELLGSEFEETHLTLLENGGAEQSPSEWWTAIDKAVKRLLSRGLAPNKDIVAIATTGQWSGTVAVDEAGKPLLPAIIWMDSRGAPYIREMCGGGLALQGYNVLKLFEWIRKTGGIPGKAGKDPTAHILYLKHVHPEIYQRTHKFLEPMDYIGMRLTGRIAASFNSIALHWLADIRKISAVTYDRSLLKHSTIERSKLPDLQPANSILGLAPGGCGTRVGSARAGAGGDGFTRCAISRGRVRGCQRLRIPSLYWDLLLADMSRTAQEDRHLP